MSVPSDRAFVANETIFREINETFGEAAQKRRPDGTLTVFCECGDDLCGEEILLPIVEYERVRAHPTWFVIRPGHLREDIEVVVERNDRYWIVQKIADAADVARETDPRS